MPFKLWLSVILAVFSIAAPAHAKPQCQLVNDTTLSIKGYIDKHLTQCVQALDLSQLQTVVLNTGGGDVETAIDVGDILAPYKPHMIIEKNCHSSCSNYWLPLAPKISFKKNARIYVHGGIDPAQIKLMTEREGAAAQKLQKLVDLQDDYLARHNIPRGWVQYRTDYSLGLKAYPPWLVGDPVFPDPVGRLKLIVVTQPMLKSCLPDIEISGYENSHAARASEKQWRRHAKKGRVSSGTMMCPKDTVNR